MSLVKLDIYHVRNIQKASIQPCPAINLIVGDNASGKSSLLEAIYILGRAKSFRSATIKSVISLNQEHLVVSAQLEHVDTGISHLGIQLDGKTMAIRINQESKQQRSELAYALPLQLIHPKSYELLDSGAQSRREFLDWGIFNDDKQFLPVWRRFKKALAQRNALLKTKQLEQLPVWNKELVYYGTIVHDYRVRYIEKLRSVFVDISQDFLAIKNIAVHLLSGWDVSKTLSDALDQDFDKDLRYGFTHSGPHRGDFQVFVNQRLAKDFVSRGQLKLLVLSLKLGQVQLLADEQNHLGCVLIDDFSAELDANNRSKLLSFLASLNCQVFITANAQTDFGDLSKISIYKMFHVEQGTIKPM
ncbi:MAG: DNA replication/repair protein RecF [Methylovulum sp.]|uniref:DNA replication/repair protein RecF n=1 Tax=Methylovulum sp. TaxID=1916980 RepID=UPI0026289300|nr:DNA replication/repair protein RecF [Methylovulum sp.]MDD2723264.1 DNA replication/repair protein RecF [Methylovulum sp.]MDD5123415.1 DNA replication/repair protein RecF [Methylovulum sp.]